MFYDCSYNASISIMSFCKHDHSNMSVFIVRCSIVVIVTIKICYLTLPFSVTDLHALYELGLAELLWLNLR